jgi:hypothetical protein
MEEPLLMVEEELPGRTAGIEEDEDDEDDEEDEEDEDNEDLFFLFFTWAGSSMSRTRE